MLAILYILTMAVAFSLKFNGELVFFYWKYFIAAGWTMLWAFDVLFMKKKISGQSMFYMKMCAVPPMLMMAWTIVIWMFAPPAGLTFKYFSTMVSNILALALAATSAVAAGHFFKRDVIKYTVMALALSTFANAAVVIPKYGMGEFIQFLKTAWIVTDVDYVSSVSQLSLDMEVHDSTVACGLLIVYYLFLYKSGKGKNFKSPASRWVYLGVMAVCAYLGFKRLVVYGIAAVALAMLVLSKKRGKLRSVVKWFGIGYIIVCFSYVMALKSGLVETLANILGIDFSGRFTIYSSLTAYYNLWPFYIGTGYGYINKTLADTLGFQSHSDIVRMYAELGFVPYLLWLIHYLVRIPEMALKKFGDDGGRAFMVVTVYIFITYFAGNTMNLYASQFAYMIIPIAMSYKETKRKKRRKTIGAVH